MHVQKWFNASNRSNANIAVLNIFMHILCFVCKMTAFLEKVKVGQLVSSLSSESLKTFARQQCEYFYESNDMMSVKSAMVGWYADFHCFYLRMHGLYEK